MRAMVPGAAALHAARAAGLADPADACQALLGAELPSHHPQGARASAHPRCCQDSL